MLLEIIYVFKCHRIKYIKILDVYFLLHKGFLIKISACYEVFTCCAQFRENMVLGKRADYFFPNMGDVITHGWSGNIKLFGKNFTLRRFCTWQVKSVFPYK